MSEKELAKTILRYLENLGGFDHWWDNIEEDTKFEIVQGLVNILEGYTLRLIHHG